MDGHKHYVSFRVYFAFYVGRDSQCLDAGADVGGVMRRRKPYRRMRRRGKSHCRVSRSSSGSQLLEFALVVPLLLAMVIGILDFGQAYNLKQKLTNAAREGARFAIEEPCADCSQAAP